MTMLAKHNGFHGLITREEAVSRLQKYKHLGVVWLLRSRNPRTYSLSIIYTHSIYIGPNKQALL
jgi:hypothetical protein